MAYQEHQISAKTINARCAVVTLSDTRTIQTDVSGKRIAELLIADGHSVGEQRVIRDDAEALRGVLTELLGLDEIHAILTTGGTGVSRRDQTVGVTESILETPLPGFGELFRMLSWAEIGSGAMLSRAIGGIARGKAVFAMPGSTAAVELAMTKLILPELRHILFEAGKHGG
jgi:molybdenum cofactor biosynthesis protein B